MNHRAVSFLIVITLIWFQLVVRCGCAAAAVEPGAGPQASRTDHGAASKETHLELHSGPYGKTTSGRKITRYTLTNAHGMRVAVIDYGAVITAVEVPDRRGKTTNVLLGFPNLAGYETNAPYFGALCGRYAGRIANGRFRLNGKTYSLAQNDPPNHEHGGIQGFNKVVWKSRPVANSGADAADVQMTYTSRDGEEGYPGTLKVTVAYWLSEANELKIEYRAVCDKPTPINLTSHGYWNLAGAGNVLRHRLTLNAAKYLPADAHHLPTGEIRAVRGTPMDFTHETAIGQRINQVAGGYDHCYVIDAGSKPLAQAARVREPNSGRVMVVLTTEPGVQLYTGNYLDGSPSSGGFEKYGGFCLECQHFPDSPNRPAFPNTILKPGETYRQTTIYRFSVEP